jgi:1-acyl-sn-glycerol-3-phosphate acyltransferase
MRSRRVQVTDALEDDFGVASRYVRTRKIDESYRYVHRNPLWQLASALLYYLLAPLVGLVLIALFQVRFTNRSAIRRAGGCYTYANHTHWMDVFMPFLLAFPKRAYVITGPTAVSIPVVRHLVAMLGGVPLNTTAQGKQAFRARLADLVRRGHPVAVFPEAHMWPYYNGIREFRPYAFTYPVHDQVPVVGYVLTYRRRRWLRSGRPAMAVTVDEPLAPERWQGANDPKRVARDHVHAFMCATVRDQASYGWIQYELEGPDEPG